MSKRYKRAVLFLPMLIMAFSPLENNNRVSDYYNNFRLLKDAGRPKEMKIIRLDNLKQNRSVVEQGILLTIKNRKAKAVQVSGDFSNWRAVNMERGNYGVWFYFLSEYTDKTAVKYKFIVDGIWTYDLKNPEKEDDGNGSYVSVLNPAGKPEGRYISFNMIDNNLIEFRIYKPRARFISIVGDFNNWNPENDLLEKGDDGIWRIRKRLSMGIYRYKYIIDGEWHPDYFNKDSATDDVGEICSVIKIK